LAEKHTIKNYSMKNADGEKLKIKKNKDFISLILALSRPYV